MTLSDEGFLDIPPLRLEYRMIGPRPDAGPTIVMLHEGLGSSGLWGAFPDQIAVATGAGVCRLVDHSARAMFLREHTTGLPPARLLPAPRSGHR